MKKIVLRLALIMVALALGAGLGYFLLVGFEPMKVGLFGPACCDLGWLLYKLDCRLMPDRTPPGQSHKE